jgi:hypothetical protein
MQKLIVNKEYTTSIVQSKIESNMYEHDKYVCAPEGVRAMVERYGVAIVDNVINTDQMKLDMFDLLEQLKPNFKRDDQTTWREFYDLFPMHSMLLQHHGVGHSKLAWNVRRNRDVISVFEKIWNVNKPDLVTSFDGISIHLPPEVTNKGWFRNSVLHTDQSYTRPNFECIQSWVTAYDVNEGDATLTFLESSNIKHAEFARTFPDQDLTDDWHQLKDPAEIAFYNGCEQKSIKCPAGSMVFWDSRTIHSGQEAMKTREQPNMRCVVYVCMLPRGNCNMNKKIKAFEERRTTNHHPCRIKMFPKLPRTYGRELKFVGNLERVELADEDLHLAGY